MDTGTAALLSSFTITVIVEIHISFCSAAFFHQVMRPFRSLHRLLVITRYNVSSYDGATYFSILNILDIYSARYPLGAQIALVVAANPVPFGGDKQVQTTARELAPVAHHR